MVKGLLTAVGRFLDRPATAWAVGMAVPPVMLFFDPVVFRGSVLGSAILGAYRPGAYVGIALGVGTMALSLAAARPKAWLGGAMGAACLFALALGLAMLPFSLLGILALGLGLLGFSPFACAVVFGWWCARCIRTSSSAKRPWQAAAGFLIFAAVCVGSQVVVSDLFRSSVQDIMSGRLRKARTATDQLRRVRLLLDMDQCVPIWQAETDPERRQRLEEAFAAITGGELKERVSAAD